MHDKHTTPSGDARRTDLRRLAALSLAALGVVFGDIGTSPLYAMRECFHGPHGIAATSANVLGVLSLIFWALIVVISVKYLIFILRADHRGEGGILALSVLVQHVKSKAFLALLGLFGAALLYSDGNALRGRPIADRLIIADVQMDFAELPSADEFIRRAARGNFELRQREIELAQQGFRVRLAENEAWPSLTLGPQFSQENAGREKETIAGIGVSVPLPLWNRNEGGVATANARLLQAETSLKLMLRGIERRIRENAAGYERLRKEMARLNPKVAEQLREAAVLADRHYRLGAVPLATYLEVQKSYLEALEALFATQADALHARAELDLLTGASIPPALRAETPPRRTATTTTVTTRKSQK